MKHPDDWYAPEPVREPRTGETGWRRVAFAGMWAVFVAIMAIPFVAPAPGLAVAIVAIGVWFAWKTRM